MRVPNDTPEQLKIGLGALGIWGGITLLIGLKELVRGQGIGPNFLFGIVLLGITIVAWRKAFYY